MEVTNLLNIGTRAELYQWYLDNHDTAKDFWLRVNRANAEYPGVIRYVDAVEVALCFGWIDSTQKRIDDGKPVQHFTPRSKHSNWCWNNIERCRRLIDLGEMTQAGLAVLPDHNPDNFVFEQWVVDALKADPVVWRNFHSFPGAYRRIKVDRIQHYNSTKRSEYAMHMLQTLIDDTRKGKMQPGWDDGGKLLGY
ncbi:MAG: YdeI/OmpD-associated family protein [Bacteroidales bacterium]|nr:YdeI/OmpD-associated family protein [Bacteroidales bacterium]